MWRAKLREAVPNRLAYSLQHDQPNSIGFAGRVAIVMQKGEFQPATAGVNATAQAIDGPAAGMTNRPRSEEFCHCRTCAQSSTMTVCQLFGWT